MNRPYTIKGWEGVLGGLLGVLLPALSWANISNTAAATYKDIAGNSYSANSNTATVTVTVAPTITLTKTANPTSARSGDTVTFTIAYQNSSTGSATNTVITDSIPTGSAFVTGSITGGGALSANSISWNLGTVAGGASGSVTFQVKVN